MRVLQVVHGFPPAAVGGTEIYVRGLAGALARLGADVWVLTRESDPAREDFGVREEDSEGIQIARLNQTFATTRGFVDTYRSDGVRKAVGRWLDRRRFDVVHVHHLTGLSGDLLELFADRGLASVMTLHDYWMLCHRGQLLDLDLRVCAGPQDGGCARCVGDAPNPLRWSDTAASGAERSRTATRQRLTAMRQWLDRVDCLLSPSRALATAFIASGVASDRVRHWSLGIDLSRYLPRRERAPGPLRAGFLGTLMVSKAPHLLLEAACRLPVGAVEARLFGSPADYHGDTSYREILSRWRGRAPAEARALEPAAVPAALAELDVLVLPSIWPENSPLVVREAFAAGLPVVASRIGGIPEIVEHEVNGLLFEPGNAEALAAAFRRLIEEPDLLARLRGGLPAVRSLNEDAAATLALYGEVGARRAAAKRPRIAALLRKQRTPQDYRVAVRGLGASRRTIDRLLVVDSASGDGSALFLAPRLADGELIAAEENLGYAGGMNRGIREALVRGADLLLLLNADVIVPPDAIGVMEAALLADPGAGIAGPLILARSVADRVASAGMSFSPRGGRMRHQGFGLPPSALPAATRRVDAVEGSVMLVRREVFEKVGFFDERYFFGFEDLDLCLRARRAGFATLLVGGARAYHEGGASQPSTTADRLNYGTRNQLLVARDADPGAGAWRRGSRFVSVVALNLAHALLSSRVPRAAGVLAVAAGAREDWRRRYGQKKTRPA
jgi:GT2 family glycosyltransferase/glycosyltransferase involved in cell wall biosynthesis